MSINPYILLLLLLASGILKSAGQHNDTALINQDAREVAIDSLIMELRLFQPEMAGDTASILVTEVENERKFSVRVNGTAFFKFGKKDWAYILSVSSHDSPQTGDITMGIDNKGRIFLNEGHVCGGIIHFETTKIRTIVRSRQFFSFFVSDVDGLVWKRVK